MINYKEHAELIKKAQLGDRGSLSRLAEVARVHLREYVLRLTLQEDLTEDIVLYFFLSCSYRKGGDPIAQIWGAGG